MEGAKSSGGGGSSSSSSAAAADGSVTAQPRDVLFFGDSLTWGMAHKYTGRYDVSWPRLLEARLNERGYNMVESALCSRTTTLDDPTDNEWLVGGEPHFFNGMSHFAPEFLSHDCRAVVVLLGTNDLKVRIRSQTRLRGRMDAQAIANACAKIGLLARKAHDETPRLKGNPLTILFVAPPVVRLNQLSRELGYDETSVKISQEFPSAFRKMCKEHGFEFVHVKGLDMDQSVDGVHVTEEASRQIAEAVWESLQRILENRPSIAKNGDEEAATGSNDDEGEESVEGFTKKLRNTGSKVKNPSRKTGTNTVDAVTAASSSSAAAVPFDASSKKPKRSRLDSAELNEESTTRTVDLKDLIWIQCRECGKLRMTNATSGKTNWTCRDEFWSERLEEWKIGCGWSADPSGNNQPPPILSQQVALDVLKSVAQDSQNPASTEDMNKLTDTAAFLSALPSSSSSLAGREAGKLLNDNAKPEKRGRGRPPGSTNKPKSGLPRGRPLGSTNKPKPDVTVTIQSTVTGPGMSSAGAPIKPIATKPGDFSKSRPIAATLSAKSTPMYAQPSLTMMQGQPGAAHQMSHTDNVKTQLLPFIERICSSLPTQFQKPITQLASIIGNDSMPPVNQMQAFSELRQMFASYPHIINDLDVLVQSHPVLGKCFVSPQSMPQYVYWPSAEHAAHQQMAFYSPHVQASPQPMHMPHQMMTHMHQPATTMMHAHPQSILHPAQQMHHMQQQGAGIIRRM